MMVAARSLVSCSEPSLPVEVAGLRKDEPLMQGVFDPADLHGLHEDGIVPRPHSLRASSERRRGMFVGQIACPVLVIGGEDFGGSRARPLAGPLKATLKVFPELGHVALLHDEVVLTASSTWLDATRHHLRRAPTGIGAARAIEDVAPDRALAVLFMGRWVAAVEVQVLEGEATFPDHDAFCASVPDTADNDLLLCEA